MRRRLPWIALAVVLLFAGATLAGFWLGSAVAPDRVRRTAESRLARELGAPVRLGSLRVWFGLGLWLEAGDVSAGPWPGGAALHAERASARLDPWSLLRGRIAPTRVVLDGADLELAVPLDTGREAPPPGLLDAAARRLGDTALPLRRLDVRGGRLRVATGAGTPLALGPLDGRVARPWLGRGLAVDLEAGLGEGAGSAALELRAGPGEVEAGLSLDAVSLASLTPFARALGLAAELRGRASGEVAWRGNAGGPHAIALDLSGRALSVRPDGAEQAVTLARPRLRGRLELAADRLRARDVELAGTAVPVRLEGEIGWPPGPGARVALTARTADVPVAALADAARALPFEGGSRLAEGLARVEQGRVERLEVVLDSTPDALREALRRDPLAQPGAVRLELALGGAALRVGEGDRLEDLSGALSFDGDRLALRDVRARFRGRPLPRLEGEVRGLAQVRGLDELNCVAPPAGGSFPGTGALLRWLRSRRKPGDPSWERLALRADWVSHPALLCSLEQVTAEIVPRSDGGEVTLRRGVWAGLAVAARGRYQEPAAADPDAAGRVELEVDLGPPFEAMAVRPPADPWASGRFHLVTPKLGDFHTRAVDGRFRASGARLHLEEARVALAPAGEFGGELELDLADTDTLPFRLEAGAADLALEDLARATALPERLAGRLEARASFGGELIEGRPLLAAAAGRLTLHARDGAIHSEFPLLMALAVASERESPLRGAGEIRFERLDLEGTLVSGWLTSDTAELDGPRVRMVASGRIGVVEPHAIEAVIGVLLFPGLDRLIDRVPVIDRLILGPNRNLLGAYYAVTGPWKDPSASFVPVKSIAEGPAALVLEDLPSFVGAGIRRIHSALVGGAPTAPATPVGRADS